MEELSINYYFESLDEFKHKELFENVKYPWESLSKINEYLDKILVSQNIKENLGEIGEFVSIKGNYYIGKNTKISSNVTIEGPVYIGDNVTIQSGALIRPYSIIGDGCVVGHSCEVKHSIVQNKAKVQSFTFIGDSIIGKSTRIGSGSILANRRFDQSNIKLKKDGEIVDVGTDFFGSVIGDNSRIGANSTTLPGTFVGPYTWVMPTVQLRGFVPREKRIYSKQELVITDNQKLELK